MQPYYIGCDVPPEMNNAGNRLQCKINDGATSYTEQQVSDLYSPPLSAEEAWLVSGSIFMLCFFSWGFRLALKQYNLGV